MTENSSAYRIAVRPQPSAQPDCTNAHGLAAVLGADHFADQHRAGGPLATETEAHQGARNQQLFVALGEAAEEGEEGKPQHRQLQGAHATDAVGENPATQPPMAEAIRVLVWIGRPGRW